MHIKCPRTAPRRTSQCANGNVALPAPYQLPKRAIRGKRLGRSQLQRQIHEKIPLEGIRFDDMGPPTIQSKIVFSNPVQIISKQPVRAFDRQREHVRDLKQHVQRGMVSCTAQVREQVLRDQLATFEGVALPVVRWPDLPMQLAEMSKRVKNLGAGDLSIHNEGLLL